MTTFNQVDLPMHKIFPVNNWVGSYMYLTFLGQSGDWCPNKWLFQSPFLPICELLDCSADLQIVAAAREELPSRFGDQQ